MPGELFCRSSNTSFVFYAGGSGMDPIDRADKSAENAGK